jgi:hypothetical protein
MTKAQDIDPATGKPNPLRRIRNRAERRALARSARMVRCQVADETTSRRQEFAMARRTRAPVRHDATHWRHGPSSPVLVLGWIGLKWVAQDCDSFARRKSQPGDQVTVLCPGEKRCRNFRAPAHRKRRSAAARDGRAAPYGGNPCSSIVTTWFARIGRCG